VFSNLLVLECFLIEPSALCHCWLGVRKSLWPVKKLSDELLAPGVCLERGANDLNMAQLMLLPPANLSSLASLKSRMV